MIKRGKNSVSKKIIKYYRVYLLNSMSDNFWSELVKMHGSRLKGWWTNCEMFVIDKWITKKIEEIKNSID